MSAPLQPSSTAATRDAQTPNYNSREPTMRYSANLRETLRNATHTRNQRGTPTSGKPSNLAQQTRRKYRQPRSIGTGTSQTPTHTRGNDHNNQKKKKRVQLSKRSHGPQRGRRSSQKHTEQYVGLEDLDNILNGNCLLYAAMGIDGRDANHPQLARFYRDQAITHARSFPPHAQEYLRLARSNPTGDIRSGQ
jgi:hypothetical protein